jgi:PAS domain S-box-containing protein
MGSKKHEIELIQLELRRSEERYHKMIDEVSDYAIIMLSPEGIIENWNKGAKKIKGYSAQEIIGKNFKVFYTDEDQKNKLPDRLLEEARSTGRVAHEGWRVQKSGTRFWGSVVITALHDNSNNVIGFTKVTRDLTERKHAEDKLRENAENLEKANYELDALNEELGLATFIWTLS